MSLRLRLVLAFGYVLLLVIVVLEVPLALNLSRRVDAEVKAEAAGQAQILAASAAGRLDSPRELERLIRSSARSLGGRVIVVDVRGRLLADSAGRGLRSVSYASRPEITRALSGSPDQGTRRSESLGQELLFTAAPVIEENTTIGAVRVTQSVDSVNDEVRNDVLVLVGVGAGALLLGLGVVWLIAGSLARPLRRLAATARRVASGDLSARAEVSGSREQQETALAFNDMTERLARALAAQKDFAGNASHQLRTPLTGLRLRLEAAALRAEGPRASEELAAGEKEAERLSVIVRNLLALARDGERPDTAATADLAVVAQLARERWVEVAANDSSEIELRGPESLVARASEADLGVICDNLIENALGHSPAGAPVVIEWGAGDASRNGSGEEVWLAVLDEGPGLAPSDQNRVFERFYRAGATRGGGSGLGLAVVRMLAGRWGGSASIENRPGGGARAVVSFRPGTASVRTIDDPSGVIR